jgi:uncharacterized membrane protein YeaQ/YmgE (transglycosylase-associated protein family)
MPLVWSMIAWLVLGAAAGLVASKVAKYPLRFEFAIIIGIIGAFIGGWLLNLLGLQFQVGGINLLSFITALIGSILLLAIVSLFTRK